MPGAMLKKKSSFLTLSLKTRLVWLTSLLANEGQFLPERTYDEVDEEWEEGSCVITVCSWAWDR